MRGSEWIMIGVDTGAGKTAWPQSITYGTTILGVTVIYLTFRTATGELVKGGKRMQVAGCDDWGSNLRVRGVQAPVCKPLLSVGEYSTKGGVTVLFGNGDSRNDFMQADCLERSGQKKLGRYGSRNSMSKNRT